MPSRILPIRPFLESAPLDLYDWEQIPRALRLVINEAGSVTLAASAVRQVVISYTLPQATRGVIRFLATAVPNAAHWDNVRWALQDNGNGIIGWDNIQGPFCWFQSPLEVLMPLAPGHTIRWVGTNLTTGAIQKVTGLLRGYYWRIPEFGV